MKFKHQSNSNTPKIKLQTLFGSLLLTFFMMLGTTSFAQERENVSLGNLERFNQADKDSDTRIDRSEFEEWMREEGIFEKWDADKDQKLTKEEVDKGTKTSYDTVDHVIGNYYIVESEHENDSLDTGAIANPKLDLNRIDDWDLDNDGYFSEAEMNSGVFDYFDGNSDDFVDYDEFSSTHFPDQYTD